MVSSTVTDSENTVLNSDATAMLSIGIAFSSNVVAQTVATEILSDPLDDSVSDTSYVLVPAETLADKESDADALSDMVPIAVQAADCVSEALADSDIVPTAVQSVDCVSEADADSVKLQTAVHSADCVYEADAD